VNAAATQDPTRPRPTAGNPSGGRAPSRPPVAATPPEAPGKPIRAHPAPAIPADARRHDPRDLPAGDSMAPATASSAADYRTQNA